MRPSPEAPVCPECGRKPTFGAQFCPYCGVRLPDPSREGRRRVLPAPDRDALTGPCAVLYCGAEPLDVRRVGRIVAEHTERPLPDVTREIRNRRGILARGCGAESARRLARRLEDNGVAVLLLSDAELDRFEPMMRMTRATFGPSGLVCEAYEWDKTVNMEVPWGRVLLCCCGRFVQREVLRVGQERSEAEDDDTGIGSVFTSPASRPKLETRERYEYVMDVFCDEPPLRLRMDENSAGYALVDVGSARGNERTFYRAAKDIVRFAPDVPMNEGVRLLAESAPPEVWAPLVFEDKRDFEAYGAWLLQLVRHGFPLPEPA